MARTTINSVVCYAIVFIVAAVHCLHLNGNLDAWKKHAARTQQFTCSEPRPRSFRVSKLFKDLPGDVIPWDTVLHVCDDSAGCCADKSQICKVQKSEPVILVFLSTISGIEYLEREAQNHTSCSCQAINDTIK